MRTLLAFLLIAAAAVAVALLFKLNTGYAMFVLPGYRIEMSANAFIVLAVLAFIALYAVLRMAARLSRLPAYVRESRRRQQIERARAKQDAAIVALLEGRAGKARQFADESLAIPNSSPVAALIGARAALETRDYSGLTALLGRADAQATNLAVPRLMLEAESALERGRANEALDRLAALRKEAGLHTAALRLELRALTQAGRHAEIPALVDQLVKRNVYDAPQGALIRASAHAEALLALSHDANALKDYWSRIGDADRLQAKVAGAGARSFLALGGDREAAEILARSLAREWDSDLAVLYAECRAPDFARQLETAEGWLAEHNQDAKLLYALGRLCERRELWGKAETYLEASLALDDHWRTRVALGELYARLDRREDANAQLAKALELALAELSHARPS
jgi:HemY protein